MNKILFTVLLIGISCTAQNMTKIIAHRGAWKEFNLPQNSVASLKKAIEIGCDGTEFDIHRTKDNQLIIYHDDAIDGKLIEDYNLKELNTVYLSNKETIPLLKDFLEIGLQQNKTKLILELKSSPTNIANTINSVSLLIDELKNYAIDYNTIELIVFSWEAAIEAKRLNSKLTISYLNGDKSPLEIKTAGLNGLDYNYNILLKNEEIMEDAKKNNLLTNSWTVNNWNVALQLMQLKIDYLTTDYPSEFLGNISK